MCFVEKQEKESQTGEERTTWIHDPDSDCLHVEDEFLMVTYNHTESYLVRGTDTGIEYVHVSYCGKPEHPEETHGETMQTPSLHLDTPLMRDWHVITLLA